MRRYNGYVATGVYGSEDTFYFEVEDDATEEDVETAMVEALWESGVIDVWCKPEEAKNE